jgi:hypothetical protein
LCADDIEALVLKAHCVVAILVLRAAAPGERIAMFVKTVRGVNNTAQLPSSDADLA